MIKINVFDAVTALVDVPSFGVRAGDVGAVVEVFGDGTYEVDFSEQEREGLFTAPMQEAQIQVISAPFLRAA